MAKFPGMLGDVSFGEPDAPPLNWRADKAETDDEDDRPLTRGERKALTGMLGFDPAELETDVSESTLRESGFTGVAANGHHYVNGEQVTKEEADAHAQKDGGKSGAPTAESAQAALDETEKTLGPEIDADPKLKSLASKTYDAVQHIVKTAILGEFPVWATETCDLWMFENAMNQSGGSGSVMAVKVAGFSACKAWMAARALFTRTARESLESVETTPDLHAVAVKLHGVMQQLAAAGGFAVPGVGELVERMEKRQEAARA